MDISVRTDKAHPDPRELAYPPKADSKGQARKSWQGKSYSFGHHDTPESWVLFGEWRRRVISNGEALPLIEVRKKLVESGVLDRERTPVDNPTRYATRGTMAGIAACAIALCVIGVAITWSVAANQIERLAAENRKLIAEKMSTSRDSGADVDEEFAFLTDREKSLIRAQRRHTSSLAKKASADNPRGSRADRIAAMAASIKEGSAHGKEARKNRSTEEES